jgi:hypothetical protein
MSTRDHDGRSAWNGRLHEHTPRWPHRRSDPGPGRERWLREPEPFEDRSIHEPYPGATVLEDMNAAVDAPAALRILARYTVIRVLLLTALGRLRGSKLRAEQRIAKDHLALLPRQDWERHSLERLAMTCAETPDVAVVDAAIVAAEAAAKRGHVMGGLGLYRAAYELARDRAWFEAASRAAAGVEQLARMNEARRSTRTWRWRTRVMEERERRQKAALALAQAEADAGGDGGPPETGE